jgi:hypothetical protein
MAEEPNRSMTGPHAHLNAHGNEVMAVMIPICSTPAPWCLRNVTRVMVTNPNGIPCAR